MILLRRIVAILLLLGCVRSSVEPPRRLPDDAYIWQRAWTPALERSIAESAGLVETWRVLVSETDAHGQLTEVQPDWKALAASNKPVVIVQRIDGRMARLDPDQIAALAMQNLAAAHAGRVAVAGIEIDFDCPTSKLKDYAGFLKALRPRLPAGTALSITALPTWLSSRHLIELIDAADQTVLQVHAVADPKRGLFDPAQAHDWIEHWAQRDRKPFRVALPAYGTRVDWGVDGRLLAVTSEMPRFEEGTRSAELVADPKTIVEFVRRLELRPPPNLAGLVWFRLPVEGDKRAWSLETWRAVLQRTGDHGHIEVNVQEGGSPGLLNITLRNGGPMDMALPRSIVPDPACGSGDGANGYALDDASESGLRLQRVRDGLLPAHSSRMIGWTRCTTSSPKFHAEP